MTPVLAFDIETVPDVAGIRRLYELPQSLPDEEVAEIAFQKRRTQTGSDFLPPQLQRVLQTALLQWRFAPLPAPMRHRVELVLRP